MNNDSIEISDYTNEEIPTFGLKYIAEETGCKSSYLFAIKTIEDKFIGVLSVYYTKDKKDLTFEEVTHLQVHASSIGGVLMSYLNQ